ncbi:MAG: SNF2 helicase-associated domain-containing protein, partial [Salinivirgaceae bacterium]|nr:SNF2 helicase-associated domain-containing protein [Salinivirgaceae bacterium]
MAKFGKTWWGEQWLNSLNDIDYSNRLPRGSSYANKGAVEKITIKNNVIHAKVKGSRPSPYKVDIILPPFFEPELGQFIDKLAVRPVIISKLLNRELDPEILSIAESCGLKVFPKKWTDFKMQCSCPDWAVPCKHLAAVIYKVSAEIDNNPFLAFELHNVDLIDELNKRGIHVTKESVEIPKIKDLYFTKGKKEKIVFDPEFAYQKLSFSKLTPINEPLAALLTDFPVFYTGSGNFKEKYSARIVRQVKNARKIVQGKMNLQQIFMNATIAEHGVNHRSNQQVVINEDFITRILVNDNEFSMLDFLHQLSQIDTSRTLDYQPSTASLHTVLQFAIHLIANGAIIPQIFQTQNKEYSVRWIPAMLSSEVRVLVDKLQNILPPAIFMWESNGKRKEINNNMAYNLLSLFLTEILHILEETDNDDLFLKLFFRNSNYEFKKPGEEALCGGIQAWLQKYYITQGKYKPIIRVEETKSEDFLISIQIENTQDLFSPPISLHDILNKREYDGERFEILQSLTQLSSFIPKLDAYINSLGVDKIELDNKTFSPFLMTMIPAIQLLDIKILLPKSLQYILKPKASIKVKTKEQQGKSFLRLDQLLDFDWQIAIGDMLMDQAEFQKLLKKSDGLIKYKSNYIFVRQEELEKLYK